MTGLRKLRYAVRKYVNIFRVSLIERMAYRGDFLLGTVLRFFPVITTILLWKAVFAGAEQKYVAGFNELLGPLVREVRFKVAIGK